MHCRKLSRHYTLLMTKAKSHNRKEQIKVVMASSHWSPPADIYETDSAIYIIAEIAGVNLEEMDVTLYENALVIEGQRKLFVEGEEKGVYLMAEILQGPFCLEVLLPNPVDSNTIKASYEEGLLTITLAKKVM